jgi:hypothetical protein
LQRFTGLATALPETVMVATQDREKRPPIWEEERLRYEILSFVHQHSGESCSEEVSGAQIGAALHLPYEDLYRVVHFLENQGYLVYLGAGPRVCLSEKGARYLRQNARRRRTVRD